MFSKGSTAINLIVKILVGGFIIGGALVLSKSAHVYAQQSSYWTSPQPGWLYILDIGDRQTVEQLLLIDPSDGSRKGHIPLGESGANTEMALSPDGSRLYLAELGRLIVLETATGNVIATPSIPSKLQYIEYPSFPSVAVSKDNNWFYFVTMRSTARTSEGDIYSIATYDVKQGKLLPGTASIPVCGPPMLLPLTMERQLYIICAESNGAHQVTLAADGSLQDSNSIALGKPGVKTVETATQTLKTGTVVGDRLILFTGDGRIFVKATTGARAINVQHTPDSLFVRPGQTLVSQDGSRLFVGVAHKMGGSLPEMLLVLDAGTLQSVRTITPPKPILDLAISADGRYLYASTGPRKTLLILDSTTGEVIRELDNVGTLPSQIVAVH